MTLYAFRHRQQHSLCVLVYILSLLFAILCRFVRQMNICHMSTFVPATNCAGDAWVLIDRGIHVCIACSMFVEKHSRSVQLLARITAEDFLVVLMVLVA